MRIPELERKYGKELIDRIRNGPYLDGCTVTIVNGVYDIPERDIKLAIKELGGCAISPLEWD